jgi:hypothetical protein
MDNIVDRIETVLGDAPGLTCWRDCREDLIVIADDEVIVRLKVTYEQSSNGDEATDG